MTTIIRQNLSVKSCGAAANMTGKMTLTLSAYAALAEYPLNMDARQQYYWIRTILRRAACFTAKATAAYTIQLAR